MAEDTKKNSLLAAAVAAPVVGAVGYSIADRIRSARINPAEDATFESGRTAIRRKPLKVLSASEHLAWMNRQSTLFRTEQGFAAAKRAWVEAYRAADPITKKTITKTQFNTADEMMENLNYLLAQKKSTYTDKLFGSFKRNVDAITGQAGFPFESQVDFIKARSPKSFGGRTGYSSLPPGIQSSMRRIKRAGGMSFRFRAFTREGWKERGLGAYGISFDFRGLSVSAHVPVAKKGVMAIGGTQQTKRLAPDVVIYDPTTKQFRRMPRHEFYMEALEKNVIQDIMEGKLKSQREVNMAVKALNDDIVGRMQAVRNAPAGALPEAAERYAKIRGKSVQVFVERPRPEKVTGYFSRYAPLPGEHYAEMLEATGLKVGTSPKAIKAGMFTSFDYARYQMTPSAFSYARRVEQSEREWFASGSAQKAMKASKTTRRWQIFETPEFRAARGGFSAPHMKTLYLDPGVHGELLEEMQMGEGEAQISKRMRSELGVQKAKTAYLKTARKGLQQAISEGTLQHGDVLGWSTEGKAVKYRKGMSLLGLTPHWSKGKGEHLALQYLQEHKIRQSEKFFGDFKAVARFVSNDMLNWGKEQSTSNQFLHRQNIAAIVNADNLKKNPALHNKQMITALWETMRTSRSKEFIDRSYRLSSFMQNPRVFAALLEKQAQVVAGGATAYSHEAFVENLMKFALREGKLGAREFGGIFGLAGSVLKQEKATEITRKVLNEVRPGLASNRVSKYIQGIEEGVAFGVSQVMFGKTKAETGAGRLASIEPRILDALRAGHMGEAGKAVAAEYAERLAITNPEKVKAHLELTKILESVEGTMKPGKGDVVYDVFGGDPRQFKEVTAKGGFLRFGKGKDIYLPGRDTMNLIRPFETASGKIISGDLARQYKDLISIALSEEGDFNRAVRDFTAFVGQHQAIGGKGAGGVLRGKFLGSASLTGVSAGDVRWTAPDVHTVGVPRHQVEKMISDMKKTRMYTEEMANRMMQRFEAGERVAGMLGRHPAIGPYSTQFSYLQMLPKAERGNVVYMPSKMVDVKFQGIDGSHTLQMSPMIGMAGDLDADTYAVSLVSPDNERKIQKALDTADDAFKNKYIQHSVRMQLLKAKRATEGVNELSTVQRMAADARKLSATQEWVPLISTELSRAKQSVLRYGRGTGGAEALGLLEWLEQTPISGKNLSTSAVAAGDLERNMQAITSALQEKDSRALISAVESQLSMDQVSNDVLRRKLIIEQGVSQIEQAIGGRVNRNIEGMNITQAVENIISAQQEAEASGLAREAEILAGKGRRLKVNEIPIAAKITRELSRNGAFAGVSRATAVAKNLLSSVGLGISKHYKKVGWGFAGTLALSTALSSPPEIVGSGAGLVSGDKAQLRRPKKQPRISEETMHPPQHTQGRPSTPISTGQKSAMVTPSMHGSTIDIDAFTSQEVNIDTLVNSLNAASGSAHAVNLNVRDNRRRFNPHLLANELL